ncbi:flavodoxin family protein [archaeon]|nr:flavodoxin family protein [archaeon]
MYKIIGLVGSPRKENTYFLTQTALAEVKKHNIKTELIHLGKLNIKPCNVCNACIKQGKCIIDDDYNKISEKIKDADGIIMSSPVYFGGVSAQLKAFMDRTRHLRREDALTDKITGAIAVGASRNGGQETTIQQIHNFFLIHGAIIVGDEKTRHYGGTGQASKLEDIKNDNHAIETSKNLGAHIAKVVLKLNKE